MNLESTLSKELSEMGHEVEITIKAGGSKPTIMFKCDEVDTFDYVYEIIFNALRNRVFDHEKEIPNEEQYPRSISTTEES